MGCLVKDEEYIEQMVEENIGLVHHIVGKHFNHLIGTWDYDDLVQEGLISLVRCIEGFNEDKGYKFSTYAYSSIYREVKLKSTGLATPFSLPVDAYETYRGYLDLKETGLSLTEIAKELGKQVSSLRGIVNMYGYSSLDYQLSEDSDSDTLMDLIEAPEVEDYDGMIRVVNVLTNLLPKDLKYTVDRMAKGVTQKKIAKELNRSYTGLNKRVTFCREFYGEEFLKYINGDNSYGRLLLNIYERNPNVSKHIICYIDYALELMFRGHRIKEHLRPLLGMLDLSTMRSNLRSKTPCGNDCVKLIGVIDRFCSTKGVEELVEDMVGAYEVGWLDNLTSNGI